MKPIVETASGSASGFSLFILDSAHQFYIHPSDSLGTNLVSPLFDGSGFVAWRKSMVITLSSKNRLGLVTGRYEIPTKESPYYPYWVRCNNMVIT